MLSLAIGAVGAGMFLYGRKQQRLPHLICGIVMSVYPYFIPNLWIMGGVAVALLAGVWVAVRAGL